MKEKLVLHICCAVCGAAMVDLLKDQFEITLFYYNPNTHPREEYLKRRKAVVNLAKIYELEFFEGKYDKKRWLEEVKGLEKEPEGSKRCLKCFKIRLTETFLFSKDSYFSTTLAVSPYKPEREISEIGKSISEKFLDLEDLGLSKKEVWQRTRELSKKHAFYHQKYCGCLFSILLTKKLKRLR